MSISNCSSVIEECIQGTTQIKIDAAVTSGCHLWL